MLNIKLVIPFLFITSAYAGIDLPAVDKEIEKVAKNITKESTFSQKFKHVTYLEGFLKKEIGKVNDKNYEQEKEKLFALNFYHGNILGLVKPFPQKDCDYQRGKLLKNFSDNKTGKIHQKLINLAKIPLNIFNSICSKQ